jgi:hypothetical protein
MKFSRLPTAIQFSEMANFISKGKIKDVNSEEITRMMVGNSFKDEKIFEQRNLNENILELKNLCGEGFYNVNLNVKRVKFLALLD